MTTESQAANNCEICVQVSQAPHGWLRVTKDQFFSFIGKRDIITYQKKEYSEFQMRSGKEVGRKYRDTSDYYLLAQYAKRVN